MILFAASVLFSVCPHTNNDLLNGCIEQKNFNWIARMARWLSWKSEVMLSSRFSLSSLSSECQPKFQSRKVSVKIFSSVQIHISLNKYLPEAISHCVDHLSIFRSSLRTFKNFFLAITVAKPGISPMTNASSDFFCSKYKAGSRWFYYNSHKPE